MNWPTPAPRAASTSCSWPSWSTPLIESSGWRESVVEAVEMTVDAPRHAAASDARFLRSPWTISAPWLWSRWTLAGSDVSRASARTDCPRSLRRRQISPPSRPVAPTTRIIVPSPPGRVDGPWAGPEPTSRPTWRNQAPRLRDESATFDHARLSSEDESWGTENDARPQGPALTQGIGLRMLLRRRRRRAYGAIANPALVAPDRLGADAVSV